MTDLENLKRKNRKIKCDPKDGDPLSYFISGVGCNYCKANCYHYEYDGENIYGVCNACCRDLYIVKPEYIEKELNEGVWKQE